LEIALTSGQRKIIEKIHVAGYTTSFELNCDERPQKLAADPENHIFRRLYPSEIPPAVNAIKASASVVTVLSESLGPEFKKTAATLVHSLGLKHNAFITENELTGKMLAENDILLIGRPRRSDLLQKMPARVSFRPNSFRVNDRLYDNSGDVFFGVFDHPVNTGRIAGLFMPLGSQNADVVARKITHYGKYSYLAFSGGKNLAKGIWPVETSPLVYVWHHTDE
jgi:hypothetical protein